MVMVSWRPWVLPKPVETLSQTLPKALPLETTGDCHPQTPFTMLRIVGAFYLGHVCLTSHCQKSSLDATPPKCHNNNLIA